jgi:hypothetical protein
VQAGFRAPLRVFDRAEFFVADGYPFLLEAVARGLKVLVVLVLLAQRRHALDEIGARGGGARLILRVADLLRRLAELLAKAGKRGADRGGAGIGRQRLRLQHWPADLRQLAFGLKQRGCHFLLALLLLGLLVAVFGYVNDTGTSIPASSIRRDVARSST